MNLVNLVVCFSPVLFTSSRAGSCRPKVGPNQEKMESAIASISGAFCFLSDAFLY